MRAAELCAGYGGLALAVEHVFGAETAWVSEFEDAPSRILAHHWPTVPNHGDMTKIDWASVEPVDIISGGTPCQDLSAAGKRAGMTEGTRSNLWVQMREAIAIIKPTYVVWENVRGAYSAGAYSEMEQQEGRVGEDGSPNLRALGRVLGDLSDLGFNAEWRGLRAADVGAPHGRYRVFVLATHRDHIRKHGAREWAEQDGRRQPADGSYATADTGSTRAGIHIRPGGQERQPADAWGTTLVSPRDGAATPEGDLASNSEPAIQWGSYEPAIRRWEQTLGRRAPAPTELGKTGKHRLSPRFCEWMMGAPDGWICDVPGITRNDALKAAGNGVVPQQAIAALQDMLRAT